MEQVLQIKAKYTKDDRLFIYKECSDTEPECLIPVSVNGVSNIKILGIDHKIITYSVSAIKSRICLEVNKLNLCTLDEIPRYLK